MCCKASLLFLTQSKQRLLWAIFIYCVCFQCLCDVTWNSSQPCLFLLWWHESKCHQPCLYSSSRVWAGKVAECVCTADHVGCFQYKRVQADHKRSDWTCLTAGRETILLTCSSECVCLWQIQHMLQCPIQFYLVSTEKNLGRVYLTIITSGLSWCFQPAKSPSSTGFALEMKRKKLSVVAGICLSYHSDAAPLRFVLNNRNWVHREGPCAVAAAVGAEIWLLFAGLELRYHG